MEKFEKMTAVAAPMPLINIDTDMIIPKQFLKTIKRSGLGVSAFHEMRYQMDGTENPDFILNQEAYRDANILVAGDNFGCGSSREHAPWALLDFGIRCVISTSFADIFYNNCFKNGILPIALDEKDINTLLIECSKSKEFKMTINLINQVITYNADDKIHFNIDPYQKNALLKGLDEIGQTLEDINLIKSFEENHKTEFPWLFKKTS